MTEEKDLLQWSFALTLIGGLLILAFGVLMAVTMAVADFWGEDAWMGPGMGRFTGMALVMGVWSVLTGGAAIVAATQIRAHPERRQTWGIVAIVAGALSFLSMGGGYFLGAFSAIAGGALALTRAQPSGASARAE